MEFLSLGNKMISDGLIFSAAYSLHTPQSVTLQSFAVVVMVPWRATTAVDKLGVEEAN